METIQQETKKYVAGTCQNPTCESCKGMNIPALPPQGYMLSNGSVARDINRDLPVEVGTEWTEQEECIFRAIQFEGGTRVQAIRAYRRSPSKYRARRFCIDTTAGDWHFLPESARPNQIACSAACRAVAAA